MAERTVREFSVSGDFDAIVQTWAQSRKFHLKSSEAGRRVFQKGAGFLTAPMMLQVEKNGRNVRLEAWIRAGMFVRVFSLFILPAEIGIDSGGFRMCVPRKIARSAVNELLSRFGAPAIS